MKNEYPHLNFSCLQKKELIEIGHSELIYAYNYFFKTIKKYSANNLIKQENSSKFNSYFKQIHVYPILSNLSKQNSNLQICAPIKKLKKKMKI